MTASVTEYDETLATAPVWTDADRRAADVARALAADAVEAAGHGHPGTAISLAPAAHLLFQRLLRHDPADPEWAGRDRFVLSCGHAVLTLYVQLHLTGYALGLDDLKALRREGSLTPAHPERGHTPGVEVTTGPLGQGLANAVGMAAAARRERGLFDPDAPDGTSPFDHTIWVFASDGDLQEGVSHEAASLAGHQRLGNLVVLWDDNRISIEDDTSVALSEDVPARFRAYGWDVRQVDWTVTGTYTEDLEALYRALSEARRETGRPSLVALRTVIGWPAPTKRNSGAIHGAALGPAETAGLKEALGLDPERSFQVPDDVLLHTRTALERGRRMRADWERRYADWRAAHPERAAEYDRIGARTLPEGWAEHLPTFPATGSMATRKASGKVLDALAGVLPELWGGSADLAGSNLTTMAGEPSFLPEEHATAAFPGHRYGRTLHFGIREHAMGAVLNGIALHGGTRPYGGTFLVFSDYMRPAVRLAAMMRLPVTYVWTHDSIGLGEDGPTHQPVEHLWSLRGIPGLDVVRPADANETVVAWRTILTRADRPAGLALSRQELPVLDRSPGTGLASADGVARGGYVLAEADGAAPEVIVLATGSEVPVALDARALLQAEGIATRVVSMPCLEWFAEQDEEYRESVLPAGVAARVSVEAGTAMGWYALLGGAGEAVSIEEFGAGAPYQRLFEQFGLTPDRVAAAARAALERARRGSRR
ncbi:transketolase [Streptomyces sp. NPDC044989]|uniref:transketolase n=1 Tax=Streptomyces sp. NPDC044989 TaxID=3154336 RepID=UPI0033DCA939